PLLFSTLSLHDALPISTLVIQRTRRSRRFFVRYAKEKIRKIGSSTSTTSKMNRGPKAEANSRTNAQSRQSRPRPGVLMILSDFEDRKSTRLNSSHVAIS